MSLFSAVISAAKGATLNSRGGRYAKNGQFDCAIVDFNEVIRIEPKFADGYYNRGNAYAQKGLFHNSMCDFDRAIADFDEAIKLNPKDADYFASRGSWYAKKGQHDRAIADYDEAIKLNPNDAVSFGSRGVVYATKGQLDPAIIDFDEAIRLDPKNAYAFDNRGIAYGEKGEYERAIADHDEAIRLSPERAEFFSNRGVTNNLARQYDRAIADFDEAIRLDPNLTQAIDNRARIIDRKNKGRSNDAVSTLGALAAETSTDDDSWDFFRDIPNTKAVLEDKAKFVAHLIVSASDVGPKFAASLETSFGEDEARQAILETAAFLVFLVGRLASTLLNSESCAVFMDALDDSVPSKLRDKGIDPMSFQELLNKRNVEYAQYQKWMPDKGEGLGGILFWEFGKIVAAPLNVDRNALFQIFLTKTLLKSLTDLKLHKLLQGSPALEVT